MKNEERHNYWCKILFFPFIKMFLLIFFLLKIGDAFKCTCHPYTGISGASQNYFHFRTCAAKARATIPFKSAFLQWRNQTQSYLSPENKIPIRWSYLEDWEETQAYYSQLLTMSIYYIDLNSQGLCFSLK